MCYQSSQTRRCRILIVCECLNDWLCSLRARLLLNLMSHVAMAQRIELIKIYACARVSFAFMIDCFRRQRPPGVLDFVGRRGRRLQHLHQRHHRHLQGAGQGAAGALQPRGHRHRPGGAAPAASLLHRAGKKIRFHKSEKIFISVIMNR